MPSSRIIEQGNRSSIRVYDSGELTRVYHDTGTETPLPITIDEQGIVKISGNRSLASIMHRHHQDTPLPLFRGGQRPSGEGTHRPAPPVHLYRALQVLLDSAPTTVKEYARTLGIKESTGWCYLCKVVDYFSSATRAASRLVHPPLLTVLHSVDLSGSLTTVMQRLNNGPLRGCTEWRCVEDRYAHLRLARLCIMSAAKE